MFFEAQTYLQRWKKSKKTTTYS